MAYTSYEYCGVCRDKTQHVNRQCMPCMKKMEDAELKKEKEDLDKWLMQPMEERIRDLYSRIRKLERGEKKEDIRY